MHTTVKPRLHYVSRVRVIEETIEIDGKSEKKKKNCQELHTVTVQARDKHHGTTLGVELILGPLSWLTSSSLTLAFAFLS